MKDLGIAMEVLGEIRVKSDTVDCLSRALREVMEIVGPDADHTEVLVGWGKRVEGVKEIDGEAAEQRRRGQNRPVSG